ncbi:hypothetical protein [Psychrobacter jeotgali]|uniref:hypothetical protein n=1 Tax=Psychrobacter jeotgali TaxID=179010 RepID=UPI0019196C67|nr:hypothetical protein [Psychrobacter jeotgali]
MTTDNNHTDKSDVREAAEKANVEQIEKNLNGNLKDEKATNEPENLTEEQETSFINQQVRTDK